MVGRKRKDPRDRAGLYFCSIPDNESGAALRVVCFDESRDRGAITGLDRRERDAVMKFLLVASEETQNDAAFGLNGPISAGQMKFEADIGAGLGGDALDQCALLAFGAGWGVAPNLPVLMDRAHRALRAGFAGKDDRSRQSQHDQNERRRASCPDCMYGSRHRSKSLRALRESPAPHAFYSPGRVMPDLR